MLGHGSSFEFSFSAWRSFPASSFTVPLVIVPLLSLPKSGFDFSLEEQEFKTFKKPPECRIFLNILWLPSAFALQFSHLLCLLSSLRWLLLALAGHPKPRTYPLCPTVSKFLVGAVFHHTGGREEGREGGRMDFPFGYKSLLFPLWFAPSPIQVSVLHKLCPSCNTYK